MPVVGSDSFLYEIVIERRSNEEVNTNPSHVSGELVRRTEGKRKNGRLTAQDRGDGRTLKVGSCITTTGSGMSIPRPQPPQHQQHSVQRFWPRSLRFQGRKGPSFCRFRLFAGGFARHTGTGAVDAL